MKTPDKAIRIKKYAKNRASGMNKTDSALAAGYPSNTHTTRIEQSATFKEVIKRYKDYLQDEIGMDVIAKAHADNIRQETDKGARNAAIKMAYEKIEPDEVSEEKEDKVLVILKG